jgi:hypothetical protein
LQIFARFFNSEVMEILQVNYGHIAEDALILPHIAGLL